MKLAQLCAATSPADPAAAFERIEERLRLDLVAWLLEMPWWLARAGHVEKAVEISRTFGPMLDRVNFLGDLPVVLARANQRQEALAQVESNLAALGHEVWVVINAGETLDELGEAARAEELYRRALGMATEDYDREGVLERLVPLLHKQGRESDVEDLQRPYERPSAPPSSETRLGRESKVGRNDPCLCGSGKKFKKCCGKT